MFRLEHKVALVTGAGQGMGVGIAAALASQGATVIVNDVFKDRADAVAAQLRAKGFSAGAAVADVTDGLAARTMVQHLTAEYGAVDILVNNAGVPADGMHFANFVESSPPDWDRFVRLNLYGVLQCCHAVLPVMLQRRWGRLITISSEAWRIAFNMGLTAYAASKAGAVGFMRQLSSEIGDQGVTANCVALGIMNNAPGAEDMARARTGVGRAGTPEDVGALVVYLASEEASWMHGQVIPLNGGAWTA